MKVDKSVECEILGRDIYQNLVIEYKLEEIPPQRWSRIFNLKQKDYSFVIRSVLESNQILVIIQENRIKSTDIISILDSLVYRTNEEFNRDEHKNQILLDNMVDGLIVVHNNLSYTDNNTFKDEHGDLVDGKEFEIYLQKIIDRAELSHYQEYLNSSLFV